MGLGFFLTFFRDFFNLSCVCCFIFDKIKVPQKGGPNLTLHYLNVRTVVQISSDLKLLRFKVIQVLALGGHEIFNNLFYAKV